MCEGLTIDGEVEDLYYIKPIIAKHVHEILDELSLNYPSRTTKIYITGGGANQIGGIIQNKFRNSEILGNCQFSNAKGYKNLGVSIWQRNN
jgi:plasmid segregation protein ParM